MRGRPLSGPVAPGRAVLPLPAPATLFDLARGHAESAIALRGFPKCGRLTLWPAVD